MERKRNASDNKSTGYRERAKRTIMFFVAFLLTVVCISTSSVEQKETVQVGSVATKRYVAPEDAVDTAATERLREAAADSVGPIYKTDSAVAASSVAAVKDLFAELDRVLDGLEEGESFASAVSDASLNLPVVLTGAQLSAYETLTDQQREEFAADCAAFLQHAYDEGITADALEEAKENLQEMTVQSRWNKELKGMAAVVLAAAAEPNVVLDEDAMEIAREQKRAEVADVQIRKNQKIVDEGEIITQEIYDRLVALNLVRSGDIQGSLVPLLGTLILTGMVFLAFYLFFRWGRGKTVVLKHNEAKMLFTMYVIMVLLIRVMATLTMFTVVPAGLFAMLVSLLVGRRLALWFNALFCIVGCFIFNGDVQFLMYALISGTFAALFIQKTEKRSQLIPAALGMAAVNFFTAFSLGLFFEEGYSVELLLHSGVGAVIGLVSIIIAVGSLPFWENMFEANTPLRLMELTNPNNELLRRLLIEAPGTYHHSLIVANLAETAVYEIGGNTALARAGAYYHDVGKLRYPMYFGENQTGTNPHDELAPEESAKIITGHTKGGLELAEKYKIPPIVRDIIEEHHGNSLVKFFYFKALKLYGAENVKEEDYRYQGRIPSSRESAVVMLADTVEAAVRSMLGSGKTLEEAGNAIRGLMKDKLDDGQLNHSGLAIDELETIRLAFLKVFHGMYHERVAYPDKKDIQAAQKKEPEKEEKEDTAEHDGTH
ncbi:HDIG domain-containing protein [Anaerotignum lactatifermentans]|uniref:HDIG domain-containing protein n=1 Tax=Anaerotignum lactatifermentans TaxID=160404 RepID=A0ABS2GBZ2_9FIRM|nr:HDIG domain-containing metalloprotein [Anaerotignum lactatifermentans]MBM6829520.1 HDIG domain-containing protein [Anaerotignum lactatifermentans]MBM6878014.1 HDIG domain-containing protein [Anaerotignum lactatifermentans]MBM6951156.1 HDIG domain-containing protein [Anaerotignum lactatifermentans]